MRAALPLFVFAPGLVIQMACSSDAPAGDGGAGQGGAGAPTCLEEPDHSGPSEPQRIDRLTADLVDAEGAPVSGEPVQLCGTDICLNGTSSEGGGVLMGSTDLIRKPAFKFGDGKRTAQFAWLLPNEPEVDLGTIPMVGLPDLESAVPFVAGQPTAFAPLTLFTASNARIQIDPITFRTDQEKGLRAVRVPLAAAPGLVDAALGFEVLIAAAPFETQFCPPARLTLDNSEGWAPDSAVEVWLHGIDISEKWAPYGGWAKVSDARVSSDGSLIETAEPGLPVLGVLAFKRP